MPRARTALVIDDDPLTCLVAEEMLRAAGVADVTVAGDGAAGLEALRAAPGPIDLVLCDLQMPALDGVSVVRALGEAGFAGGLVLISAADEALLRTVRLLAQQHGMQALGVLEKPLDGEALAAMVQAAPASTLPRRPGAEVTRSALLEALAGGAIRPVYQPKLDLSRGKAGEVEVLARHVAGDGRPASPAPWLEAAEREGLTGQFARILLVRVAADAHRLAARGLWPGFALNISPSALADRSLPDRLAAETTALGLDPSRLKLELTENRLLEFGTEVLDLLARFRLRGFKLSLDDFGTGATSLEQLRLYPFNEVKVDQAFVTGADGDRFARAGFDASVRLAHLARLDVVAEGVETEADLRLALALGVRQVQGYFIARPMPADALADWLAARAAA